MMLWPSWSRQAACEAPTLFVLLVVSVCVLATTAVGAGPDEEAPCQCKTPCNDLDSSKCCSSKMCDDLRHKRDTTSVLDDLYSTYRVAVRARPFLGKRSPRYMLGKRPRNNFLGKRTADGELSDALPLLDYLEQEAEQQKRAMRPFLGKKARPMLGKRANYPDIDAYFGPDGLADDALADDASQMADKRGRMPFLGKRARRPFLGKRTSEDVDDESLNSAFSDEDLDAALDKRARRPFLGKRSRRPFLGKRDYEGGEVLDAEDVKRAARYMLGKRSLSDADFTDSQQAEAVARRR